MRYQHSRDRVRIGCTVDDINIQCTIKDINIRCTVNDINIREIERRIRCTINHMGWLRLVGSLKIYVSFAEYSLFYRALLQKSPMILGSLLIDATPYQHSRDRDNIQCTINDMGWLRLVSSLKMYVSFAEYSLFYRGYAKEPYVFRQPANRMGWLR